MKRVLAVLIVVVVLLGVWLSGVGRRSTPTTIGPQSNDAGKHVIGSDVDATIATAKDAVPERSSLAASASATPTTSAVPSDRITIRSSIGLELPFAELENDTSEWKQIALDQGACARSALAGATYARAPGHVAVEVVSDAKEIVLEPDALLVLRAGGLRHCVRAIEPWDPTTDSESDVPVLGTIMRKAIAFGWLSDDQWAIALSPDRLDEAYRKNWDFLIHWRDERTTRVIFQGKPGSREQLPLVCEDRVPGLPLKVHIVRPAGLAVGRLSIALDRVVSGGEGAPVSNYAWGSAYTYVDEDFHQRRNLDPGSSDVEFPFAPSNARLNLAARDESSGAFGRTDFVHDGSQRTLVLLPPFRLTGRLIAAEGTTLPPHVDILSNAFEGKEEIGHWDLGQQGVEVGPTGTFELKGPVNLPRLDVVPLEVPSVLVVNIIAPGFKVWQQSFDTHHASFLDCGDIHLIAQPTPVVLAPGHGLVTKSVKWSNLITSDDKQTTWNVRDATVLADGSMAISLDRDEKDPTLFSAWPGEARAWPDPPPQRLLIYVLFPGSEIRAFERDAEGRYDAVDARVRDVDFDFEHPLDRARWTIGWEWQGISAACDSIDSTQLGEMVHLHVRAPVHGVTLIWTTDWEHRLDAGVRGGSMPIDAIQAPIVLH